MNEFRYSTAQIVVHWLSAVLIAFLLVTGTFVLSEMPNEPEKIFHLAIHAGLGALVAAMLIMRVIMRLTLPSPNDGLNKGLDLSVLSQIALNSVIALMVISGLMLAVQSQTIEAVLGLANLPEDYEVFMPHEVHEVVAKLTMLLVALHVMSVLVQHFVRKSGVLNRMRLGASKATNQSE